jgi:hypothetical protein
MTVNSRDKKAFKGCGVERGAGFYVERVQIALADISSEKMPSRIPTLTMRMFSNEPATSYFLGQRGVRFLKP